MAESSSTPGWGSKAKSIARISTLSTPRPSATSSSPRGTTTTSAAWTRCATRKLRWWRRPTGVTGATTTSACWLIAPTTAPSRSPTSSPTASPRSSSGSGSGYRHRAAHVRRRSKSTTHLVLTVGGRTIELLATPGGETTDSMVVWLPEERVCLCGNTFGPRFRPHPELRHDARRSVPRRADDHRVDREGPRPATGSPDHRTLRSDPRAPSASTPN